MPDTASDDVFALLHGTIGKFASPESITVTGVEDGTTLTAVALDSVIDAEYFSTYSHKIVGTYGTLYYDQTGLNNYFFAPNDEGN